MRFGGVELKGAAVSAVRAKDGEFDLVKALVPRPSKLAAPAPVPLGKAEPDWVVAVDKLALRGASVRLDDRSVARPVVSKLEGIDFELDGFSTEKGDAVQFKLDSMLNKRGKVAAWGRSPWRRSRPI